MKKYVRNYYLQHIKKLFLNYIYNLILMGKNIYIIFSKSINYFVEKIKKTITFKEYNYKYRHK